MTGEQPNSREAQFVGTHPTLRRKMSESSAFSQIKRAALLEIDGEELYVVKSDVLGDEEELFIEALLRGAAGQGELNRQLFEELEERERDLVCREFRRRV